MAVYARNADIWAPSLLPRTEEMEARYSNPDNDRRGPWKPGDLSARNYYGEGTYSITCPSGRKIDGPPPGNYWRVSKSKFEELDRDGRIWWGPEGCNVPAIKRFLSEVKAGRVPQTLWTYGEVGHTQEAKKELISAVTFPNSDTVFETPKPTRLMKRMLQIATRAKDEALVLDFFAGSGSTMHGIFAQNAEDGGNRRGILVQLPEPLAGGEAGNLSTIAEMTKQRLRQAGKKIREENPMFASDLGFRVFKLDTSNILAWDPTIKNVEQAVQLSAEHLRLDRTDADILHELLLKLGLDLCVSIEQRTIAGKNVHSIGAGTLVVCLAKKIARDEVESLALGIVEWHKQLAPAGECTAVFRDSAFADDVAKTNLTAILQQHGLGNVRSL